MKPHEIIPEDARECTLPICDGEALMFAEDDTMACGNLSCPNYDRWR